ncbi:MAG TPA: phosphoribosylformylglycinamidine synthase subunit PurL [Micropepsaceae bacterium]|nr:phosphoribosylformylglycinamidine synthase subunit PurL [Micropepsaceae bacterium]
MKEAPLTAITPQIVREHGLSPSEYARIQELMGRDPNLVELGIFSVMWSEHCSYKSTRAHLRKLPTKARWVLQGPGENAGVIDIGDGDACIFKMESHNHPSFIEPYQGAATGVGGIMRDVFTMGARPVAMMNALRFGEPSHPKTRHLISGVVAGIGGYGNCMGVPTVGGEVNFHRSYNGNILVNAMCVGLARQDKIFLSAAKGAGNPVVYVGSKTGRDGIHGATMASAEFNEDSEEKRPTVQVGDPFTEKLLLEACLELMATDAIIAIQDMGAAGLTSSSAEMGDKGGSGIELDLDKVPQREANMTAYDMMLSESQERMLAVLKPGREAEAERIFKKWELDFAVIGITTDTKRLVVKHKGAVVADMPITALSDEAPVYQRPFTRGAAPAIAQPRFEPARPVFDSLLTLMGSPDLCSRRWVWEQYDYSVMADTVQPPGGDAAIVRVHGTKKALAISTDVTPRYCRADPFEGAKQAVAECWRNLSAVGALPLAVTDNLNFGNPERAETMGEIVGAIDGIGEACRALDFPVISGNCSLYNETNGEPILPTPAIGGVGLIKDVTRTASIALKRERDALILIGETQGHLGQSLYLREIEGREEGAAPPVDLAMEKKNGDFVRALIEQGRVDTVHDLSDGGLLVAVAEMAMAGDIGAQLSLIDASVPFLFGEDQGRYLLAVPGPDAAQVLQQAQTAGIAASSLGLSGGDKIAIVGVGQISLSKLRAAHESGFPNLMSGDELPPTN